MSEQIALEDIRRASQDALRLIDERMAAQTPEEFDRYQAGVLEELLESALGRKDVSSDGPTRIALLLDSLAAIGGSALWKWAEQLGEMTGVPADGLLGEIKGIVHQEIDESLKR